MTLMYSMISKSPENLFFHLQAFQNQLDVQYVSEMKRGETQDLLGILVHDTQKEIRVCMDLWTWFQLLNFVISLIADWPTNKTNG